ncbi:MAG: hypothetical protein HRT35_03020 [Algicola sp.]|nr:hypothetical protein [Algicola sp.]
MSQVKSITLEELPQLRGITSKISASLSQELQGYVKSLTPLFSPRKVLGEFMTSANKDKVVGAEKNYSLIADNYKSIMQKAFGHASKLPSSVPPISHQLVLTPWESLQAFGDTKLTLVSPTRWVLGYDVNYNHKLLLQRSMTGKKDAPSVEEVGSYVVAQLVLARLINTNPGLKRLFDGLNFTVSIETMPEHTDDMPFVVLSAPCESFRPEGDMVKMVSLMSGSTSFEEMVSQESVAQMPNHFQNRILSQLT